VFDPRGSRQMEMQAFPLGSLLAGIKVFVHIITNFYFFQTCTCSAMLAGEILLSYAYAAKNSYS
ncbi:hypothetical protein, partial [Muricomes intestini]|uniref:hypothetical protein n=1 Tax=Muricomes intestini TaxID=1796634 RepID=UPI002FD9CB5E